MWVQTLSRLVDSRRNNPADYAVWREEIRAASRSTHNWETLLNDLMGPRPGLPSQPVDDSVRSRPVNNTHEILTSSEMRQSAPLSVRADQRDSYQQSAHLF